MNAREAKQQGRDVGYDLAIGAMCDQDVDAEPWDGTWDSLIEAVCECEEDGRQMAGSIAEEHLSGPAWDAYDAGVVLGARVAFRRNKKSIR